MTRVTNPDGTVRETAHDPWTVTQKDECHLDTSCTGGKVTEVRDALGRAVERRVYEEDTFEARTLYTYDALDRLLTSTQVEAVDTLNTNTQITSTYDSAGRLLQQIDPDSGTWRFGYDKAGNLRYRDDPRTGQHVQFCYDTQNRPTRRCALGTDYTGLVSCTAACTDETAYRYDTAAPGDPAVSFGLEQLTKVTDATGTTAFEEYDVRGRLKKTTKRINLDGTPYTAATTRFAYDVADHLTTLTYPDGEVVTYGYNASGQVTTMTGQGPDSNYVTDVFYDRFGRVRELAHGNGEFDRSAYGNATENFQLDSLWSERAGALYLYLLFSDRDPRGLITNITDGAYVDGDNRFDSATYTYDGLARLKSWDRLDTGFVDQSYAYNALGNLTQTGGGMLAYSTTKPHQPTLYAGVFDVTQDANGNRLKRAGTTHAYTYDAFDRLKLIDVSPQTPNKSSEYTYDYTGQRVTKQITVQSPSFSESVTRYYSRIAEATGGILTKRYLLGGRLVASKRVGWPPSFCNPVPVVNHYHLDHLGSIQLVTDKTGAAVEHVRYRPYGSIRGRYNDAGGSVSPSSNFRYEFTGYETDVDSGLEYAGARFYDPTLGLFLTHDPAREFASPYSYVGWNPINAVDPTGAEHIGRYACGTLDDYGHCFEKRGWNASGFGAAGPAPIGAAGPINRSSRTSGQVTDTFVVRVNNGGPSLAERQRQNGGTGRFELSDSRGRFKSDAPASDASPGEAPPSIVIPPIHIDYLDGLRRERIGYYGPGIYAATAFLVAAPLVAPELAGTALLVGGISGGFSVAEALIRGGDPVDAFLAGFTSGGAQALLPLSVGLKALVRGASGFTTTVLQQDHAGSIDVSAATATGLTKGFVGLTGSGFFGGPALSPVAGSIVRGAADTAFTSVRSFPR